MTGPFMTTKEVAELLGVKPTSVRPLIDRRRKHAAIDPKSSKHLFRRSLVEKCISQKEAETAKAWKRCRGWRFE